jgi:hypothetical protein
MVEDEESEFRAATKSRSTRGAPTKTIGHARAGGETELTVHCLGCYHQAVKTFEELRLWNDEPLEERRKRLARQSRSPGGCYV